MSVARPGITDLYEVCEATWPPAAAREVGNWIIRDGMGGGQRVSAATIRDRALPADIEMAEQAMQDLGQDHLFMIRKGDEALDAQLDGRGYAIVDPVSAYVCPAADLCALPRPRVSGFSIWPPLAIMADLWAEGGIGASRIAVMDRAKGPKTAIMARKNDVAAGVAYVGIHKGVAMLHALEVAPKMRRLGVGRILMAHAGNWAQEQGADYLSLLVTRQNIAANGLYASLGMEVVGHYHYRKRQSQG